MSLVYTGDLDTYRYGVWKMDTEQEGYNTEQPDFPVPEFKAAQRKLEFVSVRKLAQAMGINPSDIVYTVSGKPIIKAVPETYISISHSRNYAAFIVSGQASVGIDLEEYSDRILRIRSRFMNEEEELKLSKVLSKQTHSARAELCALYIHWCAKEAMFKALDIPGLDFKQDLRVDFCGINREDNYFKGESSIMGDNYFKGENPVMGDNYFKGENPVMGDNSNSFSENFLQNKQGRLSACYFPEQLGFNVDYFIKEEYILTCCSLI
ncbi:MAG: 4'-phosphopantetheinyl transferase superfamily protein [Bacteroidales bacterium]